MTARPNSPRFLLGSMLALSGLLWLLALPAHGVLLRDSGFDAPPSLVCPPTRAGRTTPQDSSGPAPMPPELAEGRSAMLPDLSFRTPPPAFRSRNALRIAIWGDSHVAAGFFTEGLLEGLGLRQEEVRSTYLPATIGQVGIRLPVGKVCQGQEWSRAHAYRGQSTRQIFPKGLVRATATRPDSYLWLDFRRPGQEAGIWQAELRLSAASPGEDSVTRLGVTVNGGEEVIVSLDRASDPLLQIWPEKPLATLKLRLVSGVFALDGLATRSADLLAPVVDSLGIPGATAKGWENVDIDRLWKEEGAEQYDAVLVAFGTNEGNDTQFDRARYAVSLRAALGNLRAVYPDAACVLVGPPDRGVRYRFTGKGKARKVTPAFGPLHYSRIHRAIAETQQAIGAEYDCLFWDWQALMGGPGSAEKWRQASPPLMSADLIHLTAAGYRFSGRALGERLRHGR